MKSSVSNVLIFILSLASAFPAGASDFYLTPGEIARIKRLWPDYAYAAKKVGLPVEILPAIHIRESNLMVVGKNIGGPFMLDLGPRKGGPEFDRRIREYEKKIAALYEYPQGARVDRQFRFAVLVAAHELNGKAKCWDVRGECLIDAVWGYNGRAGWHRGYHRSSPYVWNNPKGGLTMMNHYRKKDGLRYTYKDLRPGVMPLYYEIKELVRNGQLP